MSSLGALQTGKLSEWTIKEVTRFACQGAN